jgi:predicted PurR-regulated permease PerM
MSLKEKLVFWIVALILVCIFLSQISSILLPFVVAGILAYFLDPAADKLESIGFSRLSATLTIIGTFFTVVFLLTLLLAPVFYDQFIAFSLRLPEYIHLIRDNWVPKLSLLLNRIEPDAVEQVQQGISNVSGTIFEFLGKLVANVWQSGLAIINIFSLLFITPIVTFYILRDWDKIVTQVDNLLPRRHAPVIREQMCLIDNSLSGYIRGQTNVCLILGTFYAVGLSALKLEFGLLVGLGTGILSFIPYIGVVFGFAVGLTIAIFQFGDILHVSMVAAVFFVGQFIEGNFITPKIVGEKVGLHPVWIIFGLLSGAALAGFTGMLLAVPVSAIIGVMVRFFIIKYKASPLYQCDTTLAMSAHHPATHSSTDSVNDI